MPLIFKEKTKKTDFIWQEQAIVKEKNSHIIFSRHISLDSSNLWQCLGLPYFSCPWLLEYRLLYLVKYISFGFGWCFLMIGLRLYISGKNTKKWCILSLSWVSRCEYVLLLWCAPWPLIKINFGRFHPSKVTIFPFVINEDLGGHTLNL